MSDAMVECLERGINTERADALDVLHAAMASEASGCRSVFRFCRECG